MEFPSNKLIVLGGLSAAACAVAYVLFGPSRRSRKPRRKDSVPGLENLGNSCFINAVLQSLAPCESIQRWLSNVTLNEGSLFRTLSLSKSLLKTLNNLNNIECENLYSSTCSPIGLIKSLHSRGWVIRNEEQDAHELYHVLTTTLEEECEAQLSTMSLFDVKGLDALLESPGCSSLKDVAFRTRSPIKIPIQKFYNSPTKGLIASRLTCKSCGFKNPLRYDVFDSISLPIPENYWGPLRLEDCLRHWSSSELVHGVTCDSCSKLHSPTGVSVICKSTFVKQLKISKLPDCLCFHLVRTVWSGTSGAPSKRFDPVSFPEYLNMDDFLVVLSKKGKFKKNPEDVTFSKLHSGLIGGSFEKTKAESAVTLKNAVDTFSIEGSILTNMALSRPNTTNHIFKLKSVVIHLGDVYSGHFVTYRRGPIDSLQKNSWFYTSDINTHKVSYSDVCRNPAYMLIYERYTIV